MEQVRFLLRRFILETEMMRLLSYWSHSRATCSTCSGEFWGFVFFFFHVKTDIVALGAFFLTANWGNVLTSCALERLRHPSEAADAERLRSLRKYILPEICLVRDPNLLRGSAQVFSRVPSDGPVPVSETVRDESPS